MAEVGVDCIHRTLVQFQSLGFLTVFPRIPGSSAHFRALQTTHLGLTIHHEDPEGVVDIQSQHLDDRLDIHHHMPLVGQATVEIAGGDHLYRSVVSCYGVGDEEHSQTLEARDWSIGLSNRPSYHIHGAMNYSTDGDRDPNSIHLNTQALLVAVVELALYTLQGEAVTVLDQYAAADAGIREIFVNDSTALDHRRSTNERASKVFDIAAAVAKEMKAWVCSHIDRSRSNMPLDCRFAEQVLHLMCYTTLIVHELLQNGLTHIVGDCIGAEEATVVHTVADLHAIWRRDP